MLKMWKFWLVIACFWCGAANADTKYVQEADLAQALKNEFVEQVGEDEIELEFYGGQTSFVFECNEAPKVMISQSKFDALQNKFSANAEIFADGKSIATTFLQGKYYVLAEAWVPVQNIAKGSVITGDMLKKIKVRTNRIKPQFLTDSALLVGREAKRVLREGKLIGEKDVGKVIVVKKGDVVNSLYRTDKMQITAKVEVLEDGAKGDKIEVKNINSKRIIFAEVEDANTVVGDIQNTEVSNDNK